MKTKKLIISILLIVVLIIPTISACGSDEESETNTGTIVYVTKTGKKYHRENCTYLSNSKIEISLEKAINKGYEHCSKCKPPRE